jgi:5-hydroxyisourate hydrolase-like protein (transthyretin family)
MRSHIPLHFGDSFLDRSSSNSYFVERVPVSFYFKKVERVYHNPTKLCKGNQQISPPFIQAG